MKTIYMVGIIALLSAVMVMPVAATTWYVHDGESIFAYTGYGGAHWDDVSPGDTIFVYNGTYGVVYIDKPNLKVIGESADVVTIDCGGTRTIRMPDSMGNATGSVLNGFTVINSITGIEVGSFGPASNCIVRNCVFDGASGGNAPIGIASSNVTVENNVVSNVGSCFGIYSTKMVTLRSNTIINARGNPGPAIMLHTSDCANSIIAKNTVINSKAGIGTCEAGSGNKIYLNNFIDNDAPAMALGAQTATISWNSTEPIEYTHNGESGECYMGNYWKGYSGSESAECPGIWDTPYTVPDSLGSDFHPLMQPFENYPAPTAPEFGCVANPGTSEEGAVYGCGDLVNCSCTFNGNLTCNPAGGLIVNSNGIVIDGSGYTITGTATPADCEYAGAEAAPCTVSGIYNAGFDDVVIKNLGIENFCTGIALAGTGANKIRNNTVDNCEIHDNGFDTGNMTTHGIHACNIEGTVDEPALTVTGSKIYNNEGTGSGCGAGGDGIFILAGSPGSKHEYCNISCNKLYDNAKAGFWTKKALDRSKITYNEVWGNGNGAGVTDTIRGGIILRCKMSNKNLIAYNDVHDHTAEGYGYGIYVGGNNNTIEYNTVTNNTKHGISMARSDGSFDNVLNENTVCDNGVDISTFGPLSDTTGDNNTCDTTLDYDDDGASGCTYSCETSPPTSFVINGWVNCTDGSPVNDPDVTVTNTNTSDVFIAETNASSNYYRILTSSDYVSVGNVLHFNASNGNVTEFNRTVIPEDMNAGGFVQNITITRPVVPLPDLIVDSVSINPGCRHYYFANEPNVLDVTVKNIGAIAAGASSASVSGASGTSVAPVGALHPGQSQTVTITDPVARPAGEVVTATADCYGEVTESDETNNGSSIIDPDGNDYVINHGLKGKWLAEGYAGPDPGNMTTWKSYELHGDLNYSVGDSYYISGYANWGTYNASWTALDLPISDGATVKEARLYVYYTWDKAFVMPDNVSTSFNGVNQDPYDVHYTDRRGYGSMGSYNLPYGALVYNVTDDFDTGGNHANVTKLIASSNQVSMRGMMLVVVYEDPTEPLRRIFVIEEYDNLYGKASYCTTPEEATARALFTGPSIDMGTMANANLITVAPGAGPNEGELIFNGQVWTDVWNFAGTTELGIDERDVKDNLTETDNAVGFQSSGDWMEASNAFLVVEYEENPGVNVYVPDHTPLVAPSPGTVEVPIILGGITNYGTATINLEYDPAVVEVVDVTDGPDSTVAAWNQVAAGKISISALNTGGASGSIVFANVMFENNSSIIGECSDLILTVDTLQDIDHDLPYHTTGGEVCLVEDAPPVVSVPTASPDTILNDNGRGRAPGTNRSILSVKVQDDTSIASVTIDLSPIRGAGYEAVRMTYHEPTDMYMVETNATLDAGVDQTHDLVVNATDDFGNSNIDECVTLTVLRRGDAYRNNRVDMGDALRIARWTVGLDTEPNPLVSDVVQAEVNNRVDMGDALYIARYTVGLETAP